MIFIKHGSGHLRLNLDQILFSVIQCKLLSPRTGLISTPGVPFEQSGRIPLDVVINKKLTF